MGCMGRKPTKNNVVFIAKLYYFKGFMRAKAIIDQYARMALRAGLSLWIEDVLNPIQTNGGIGITGGRMGKMLSRRRINCPSASIGSSWPNN